MRVAIPEFNQRVSPVFESAQTVLVHQVDDGHVTASERASLTQVAPWQRAQWLKEQNVDVLLCGGVTRQSCQALEQLDIQVISCLAGPVDEVLEGYLKDGLTGEAFRLPRCGSCRGGGRRMRRRGGRA